MLLPRGKTRLMRKFRRADVVELVDTPVLGAGAVRREGSSPFIRTRENFCQAPRKACIIIKTWYVK